jgi:hypothetical protein
MTKTSYHWQDSKLGGTPNRFAWYCMYMHTCTKFAAYSLCRSLSVHSDFSIDGDVIGIFGIHRVGTLCHNFLIFLKASVSYELM